MENYIVGFDNPQPANITWKYGIMEILIEGYKICNNPLLDVYTINAITSLENIDKVKKSFDGENTFNLCTDQLNWEDVIISSYKTNKNYVIMNLKNIIINKAI